MLTASNCLVTTWSIVDYTLGWSVIMGGLRILKRRPWTTAFGRWSQSHVKRRLIMKSRVVVYGAAY